MHPLALAIQWREDVDTKDFIAARGYYKDYMAYDSISQKEIDAVCAGVNTYYKAMGSNKTIVNYMGELIPAQANHHPDCMCGLAICDMS